MMCSTRLGLAQQHMERVLARALGERERAEPAGADEGMEAPTLPTLQEALPHALEGWAVGRWAARAGVDALHDQEGEPEEEMLPTPEELREVLREALQEEAIEAALLERDPSRERVLRRLQEEELRAFLPEGRGPAR